MKCLFHRITCVLCTIVSDREELEFERARERETSWKYKELEREIRVGDRKS